MKSIKLLISTPLSTVGKHQKVRDEVLKRIPKNILFGNSVQNLCYHCLLEFDFAQTDLDANDLLKLEQAAIKIIELMGYGNDSKEVWERVNDDPLEGFMYYFLELKELPAVHKSNLEQMVAADLKAIDSLIARYRSIDFISACTTPRNQTQRTQKKFYERCQAERKKIWKYKRYGIKQRALVKAGAYSDMLGSWWMDAFFDRPYDLPHFRSERYFDYQEIDKITHRLLPIPLRKANELKGVYVTDKQSFYQQLEAHIPIKGAILNMKASVDFLPFLSPQRKAIFGELVELYEDGKFYGFYALAVPQVEGLFTEMCRICGKPADTKSLPDKVSLISPFCSRTTGLDYFEHYFPHQRNRFLHAGTDSTEDIQVLCKEIIHDLIQVIVIFNKLDVDPIHLFKLIRKKDHSEFHSIKDLSFFIKLFLSVSASAQLDCYLDELAEFREIFIPFMLDEAVKELKTEITRILAEIIPFINMHLNRNSTSFDQLGLNSVDKKIVGVKKKLKSTFQYQCEQALKEMYTIRYFFANYKQGLDIKSLSVNTLSEIERLSKEYNLTFRKIEVLITKTGGQAKNYRY